MSEELYNDGYHNITNIDFSEIAIDEMNEKYCDKEGLLI